MSASALPPDVDKILLSLKDFQRRTVDYIFARLYEDKDYTRRFLLADEVGLGKTLVAKGLIARTVRHLWDKVKRIDVVYICSNAEIARQNINRLRIPGPASFDLASRITLLPLKVRDFGSRRLNFVSFTPSTSFDLKSSLGIQQERVLLYHLLREPWSLKGAAPRNVLRGYAGADAFRWGVSNLTDQEIDPSMRDDFRAALESQMEDERKHGKATLRDRWDELCGVFAASNSVARDEDYVNRARLIGELRALLARSCLQALQPDLILMDEFQRFKNLLQADSDAGLLARELFNYSDNTTDARVLLMSATPYKMYTLHQETETDDHYTDFNRTVAFLLNDPDAEARFRQLIEEYRRSLYRLSEGLTEQHRALKTQLEAFLRKVMVRTERLAASSDRNGMLAEVAPLVAFETQDAASYRSLQHLARALGHAETMEYWKSAPYLLNFMDGYELKDTFMEAIQDPTLGPVIYDALSAATGLSFQWADVEAYERVDPGNSRLRSFMASLFDADQWKLLWIPAAMPYYRSSGCYADPRLRTFTKRLVFSSWRVVPKAVSVLLSYEAERKMLRMLEDAPTNTLEARKKRRPLLRFARSQGRLTGMPLIALVYPSAVLARKCDPLELMNERGSGTIEDAVAWAKSRIEPLLAGLNVSRSEGSQPDESWYWAAPLLLDLQYGGNAARSWLLREGLAEVWTGQDGEEAPSPEDEENDVTSAWQDHLDQARKVCLEKGPLGPPPEDLSLVLAQVALAGFGVVSVRALARLTGGLASSDEESIRDAAARVSWSFLSLFNLPESMALVRGLNREEPYWRRVLEYGLAGNLQATLDEYAHVLKESLGVIEMSAGEGSRQIAEAMASSIAIRPAVIGVEEVKLVPESKSVAVNDHRMRLRFAGRLADEKTADDESAGRADQVRRAFNSPFWPFVLATTSVGQEGLDFHQYCHAVVHWNLPSNPVDLEQREGRVHRYKGHAVRKNLALRYPDLVIPMVSPDPWQYLFDQAKADRAAGETDLVPYWVFPLENGAKIERHVPALPLSSDQRKLYDLKRSLAVYRMVFGQARQEDLVAYLLEKLPKDAVSSYLDALKVSLAPG